MIKVLCSRFLPIWTRTLILHQTLVIRIFVYRKDFKLICLALNILETSGLPDSILFDPRKSRIIVVCSRFLHVGTDTRFLHQTIVILIFVYQKYFKLYSISLKIIETPGCPDSVLFYPRKLMIKVVWSQFLPIEIHTRFLHWTIVIQIFVDWKDFKLIYVPPKILETPRLSQFCSVWPKKIDDKSCILPVSSYWDSYSLFASNDWNSSFCVPERVQTNFSRS
jgi:hypothetical protein